MADPDPKAKKAGKGGAALKVLLIVGAFGGGAAAGGLGAVMAFDAMPGKLGLGAPSHETSKLEYVELDNAFTSNLVDTGRFLQLRIAVSTTGGPSTVAALQQHKLAIVSAVLGVLGDLSEADVAGGPAKAKLRLKLRETVDSVLRQKANVAGIDEVFLTSLVVQ
ncbi:flagellar basal body-associated FliL family protein [Sphingosinicellaceae bacterium]|nr:flagellar basal body-associated FliL family protein [Sphingosinicellaceae bacterium]